MDHWQREKHGYDISKPKKRLNITVNEDLVDVAHKYTDNLSQTIEDLLADWILVKREAHRNDAEHWRKVCESHDAFVEKHGIIGAEFSRGFWDETDDEGAA